jgi:hypothetical protein
MGAMLENARAAPKNNDVAVLRIIVLIICQF